MTRHPNPRLLEANAGKKTPRKHGLYPYLRFGKLPSGRAWERVQVEVRRTREALIHRYGADKIRPDVLALVESAMEGLMVQRLSSLYIKKAGIMRADSLERGNFELHSVLCGQFIAYANLVRLNLEAAARLAKEAPEDEAFDITAYAQEFDKRADREAEVGRAKAVVGPGNVPEGQSSGDEADDTEGTS
jgi:hypothetical protein